jgi:hypothetical protein
MSWREDLTVGKLRVNRLFLGSASGYLGTELTATPAEFNYLDITTLGEGAASKAVVLNASKEYNMPDGGFFNLSVDTIAATGTNQATGATLVDQVNIVTAADGTKAVVLPAAADRKTVWVYNSHATAVLPVFPAASASDTINGGSADAAVNVGPGQLALFIAISATAWYCPLGALITSAPAELNILDGVLATAAEINQACDISGKVFADSATMVLTAAHNGGTIIVDTTAANTIALPAGSGVIGMEVTFVVTASLTSGTVISTNGSDKLQGFAVLGNDSDTSTVMWQANHGTDNRITLSPTTGGLPGAVCKLKCIAAALWQVEMYGDSSGTEATPFSAA